MKIAILGAGAMGMLFGSYLSQHNQVWLIDIDEKRIEKINADGVVVCEKNGEDRIYRPLAARVLRVWALWISSSFLLSPCLRCPHWRTTAALSARIPIL